MCNVVRPLFPIILRDGSRSLSCDALRVSAAVVSTTSQAGDVDPSQALPSSSTWLVCVLQLMACCLKSGTCPVPALLSSSAAPLVPLAFDSQSTTPSGVSMCNVVRPLSPIILRDGSRSLSCDALRASAAVVSTTSQAGDADPSQGSGLCRCPSGFVFSHAITCGLRFA